LFFFLKPPVKRHVITRLVKLFARALINIINIKIKVSGSWPVASKGGSGLFLVSNHLGYIDGFVLGATFPVVYVSKVELKKWPLIGLMTSISGTFFVDRQKNSQVSEYVSGIVRLIKEGNNVLFFPEGTSTDGSQLFNFKSAFFQAPLDAKAPIIPISIVYKTIDGESLSLQNRDTVYWYGDMTFADHFFKLLKSSSVEVEVKLHPAIAISDKEILRKDVSDLTYKTILEDINLFSVK